ncbi:RNA polymerase subunit sigma-70 [Streptomyces sp. NPDC093990]|uniref:RNA polymerase subunit sigma-70 n=1 Tax=Streptomyces sp. NPDC093990 TaxID=3155306 RepID=UPI0034177E7B
MSVESHHTGDEFTRLADPYQQELLAHCYRMLGSFQDAEDLLQETLLRAWRGYDSFDERSSLRTWLYRIATNACLSALRSSHRRVLPSGLGAATDSPETADLSRADALPWLGPIPTHRLGDPQDDPAGVAALRDSTRLALIAAFQRLPARQRAVLILVDVVAFRPAEAAEFLGISVTAARSLLQRARETLAQDVPDEEETASRSTADAALDEKIMRQYLRAFETSDTAALAELLRADIEYEMPPIPTWFVGRAAVVDHLNRRAFTRPHRSLATSANGCPAVATYSPAGDGSFVPHGIHVLEIRDGLIARIVVFLDGALFPSFGLPASLPGPAAL